MYKIPYQWSESCFSFCFLSYWQAERTPRPTPSAPSQHLQVQFWRPVHALSQLPCPWRPAEPQPWAIYQQKTAQSSEQRQHWARHKICLSQPVVPMGSAQVAQDPLKVSAGRAVVHPSELHSTKCCCAQLPGAQTFPEHTERCSVLFGLRLSTSGPQVAGYPKMWLFLHLPYFFSQEST